MLLSWTSPAAGQQHQSPGQHRGSTTALAVLGSSAFPAVTEWTALMYFLFPDRIVESTVVGGAAQSAARRSLEMLQKERAPGPQNGFLPYANACSCQGCRRGWSSLSFVSQGCSQHFHKEKAAGNCKGLKMHGTFGIGLCLWEDSCTHNKVLESY